MDIKRVRSAFSFRHVSLQIIVRRTETWRLRHIQENEMSTSSMSRRMRSLPEQQDEAFEACAHTYPEKLAT